MTRKRPDRILLDLGAGTVDVWRATAAELGYVSNVGGPTQGQGSPTRLFNALAGGEVDPGDLAKAIYRVRMTKTDEPPEGDKPSEP